MLTRSDKVYDRYTIHTFGITNANTLMAEIVKEYSANNNFKVSKADYFLYGLCFEYYREHAVSNAYLTYYRNSMQKGTFEHANMLSLLIPVPFVRYPDTPSTLECETMLELLSDISLSRAYMMTCLGADYLAQNILDVAYGHLYLAMTLQEALVSKFPHVKLDMAINYYYMAEFYRRKQEFVKASEFSAYALQKIAEFNLQSGAVHHFKFHILWQNAKIFYAMDENSEVIVSCNKLIAEIDAFGQQRNLLKSLAFSMLGKICSKQADALNFAMQAYNLQENILSPAHPIFVKTKYRLIYLFNENFKINWNDHSSCNKYQVGARNIAAFINKEKKFFAVTNTRISGFYGLCYKLAVYLIHFCEDHGDASELLDYCFSNMNGENNKMWIKSQKALYFQHKLKECGWFLQQGLLDSEVLHEQRDYLFSEIMFHCNNMILQLEKLLKNDKEMLTEENVLLLAFNYYIKTFTLCLSGFKDEARKMCEANLQFCEQFQAILTGDIYLKMQEQYAYVLAASDDAKAKTFYKKVARRYARQYASSFQEAEFHLHYARYLDVNAKWKQAIDEYKLALEMGEEFGATRLCTEAKRNLQTRMTMNHEIPPSAPLSMAHRLFQGKKKFSQDDNSPLELVRAYTI